MAEQCNSPVPKELAHIYNAHIRFVVTPANAIKIVTLQLSPKDKIQTSRVWPCRWGAEMLNFAATASGPTPDNCLLLIRTKFSPNDSSE
jgi:hypothetical protein